MDKLYQLDTGWGCGGVKTTCEGVIMETPPIFRKFIGKNVNWLSNCYKVEFIEIIDENCVEEDWFDD